MSKLIEIKVHCVSAINPTLTNRKDRIVPKNILIILLIILSVRSLERPRFIQYRQNETSAVAIISVGLPPRIKQTQVIASTWHNRAVTTLYFFTF